MKRVQPTAFSDRSKDLLLLLGEELKQPLIAIAQLAELEGGGKTETNAYARQALQTIDNMLLYQRFSSGQLELQLEPVHVGAAMQEVVHKMQPLAQALGCHISIDIAHGLQPVDVDRRLFTSALLSLWQAFLATTPSDAQIVCRAKKSTKGVYVSLQSASADLVDIHLRRPNFDSTQPLKGVAGASADLLTAQAMFLLLGTDVGKTRTKTTSGLGLTLLPSRQLQMV
jgi:signal transduction histidine kinase